MIEHRQRLRDDFASVQPRRLSRDVYVARMRMRGRARAQRPGCPKARFHEPRPTRSSRLSIRTSCPTKRSLRPAPRQDKAEERQHRAADHGPPSGRRAVLQHADRLADQSGDEHLRKAGDPGRSPGQQRLDAAAPACALGTAKPLPSPTAMIGPNNASGIQKPASSSAKASPARRPRAGCR